MLDFKIELKPQEFSYPSFRLFATAYLWLGDDERAEIGRITGVFVPNAHIYRHRVFDAFDCVSTDMERLYHGFNALDGNTFDTDLLGLELLCIEKQFRGNGYGYEFLKGVLQAFTGTTFLLQPAPVEVPASQKEKREKARRKLIKYWERFGFREIDDTGIFHHLSENRWPEASYMAAYDE